jgi:uncharacterized membrane protein YkgB
VTALGFLLGVALILAALAALAGPWWAVLTAGGVLVTPVVLSTLTGVLRRPGGSS